MTTPRVRDDGRLDGTRISVWDVLQYVERGWSFDEVAETIPVTREQFDALLRFAAENQEYVDRVNLQIEERNRRGNSPEVEARLFETRRKMSKRLSDRQDDDNLTGTPSHASDRAAG